ncbi:MAG: helix-turn-helix domain-containing protein [Pirellulales bacterium]
MKTLDKEFVYSNPLPMAVGVISERISRLPERDRDDLYESVKAMLTARCEEERSAAVEAVVEILDQQTGGIEAHQPQPPSDKLSQWMRCVGRKIKSLRARAGLTQQQLAERAGLPQSHISKLENARHSPSALTMQKIAAALKVDLAELDPSAE